MENIVKSRSFTVVTFLLAVLACAAAFYSISLQKGAPQKAAGTSTGSFTVVQKAEIETMFEEFLMGNGEMVLDSVDAFRAEEERKSKMSGQEKLSEYQGYYERKDLPMAGNPKGDVTVVEYFDYNCGYCRQALSDLQVILREDKNVRVILQEMPILKPTSAEMASVAMAAHKQGKYFEMHLALMEYAGPKNQAAYEKLAKDLGLDVEQLKKDMVSDEINAQIQEAIQMARSLGIRGTPGFVIGDNIFPGYIGLDGVRNAIKEARAAAQDK